MEHTTEPGGLKKVEKEKLGSFIKELRIQQNLTQKELADRVHVTDKAVSKWERGLSAPAVDLLQPLSEVLGVSVMELLDGQRHEEESIELKRANAILQETIARQKKVIFRKRMILLLIFAALLLCCQICGRLIWNQGLLLDERGFGPSDIFYTQWDAALDWIRYGMLIVLMGIAFVAGVKKE